MSEIKQGYKQTKVGIIPEDWEVVKLGKIATVETGKTPLRSNKQFWDNGTINWATTTEVNETYIVSTNEKITNQAVAELKMKILPINTILLAMYGQGKTRGKVALLRIESTINQAFASIKPNKNYSTNFVFNYLDKSYEKIRDLSHGSNQDNLNLDIVKALQVPLPPLKEQEKIAEILTTWDEAITKQTELLEAKELLKIALMQKLLSGEVRFDGFSDKWEEVKIKDIFEITRGYVLAVTEMSQEQTAEYKYPVYSSQTKNNGLTGYYKDYLFENCITWTTDGANAGDVNLRKGKFYCTNVCGVLKSDKGYANQCIAEILNLVTKNYVSYVGNPKLMNNTMGGIKIKIPKSLPEQQKIAEVLSLADDEINLLKNELEELKLQKKALMQKLLTGQVRVKV